MMRPPRRMALAACAIAAFVLGACIVADPLPEQRSLPTRKPSILTSASPPAFEPFANIRQPFSVPLQLYNPLEAYEWRVYIDWDSKEINQNSVESLGQRVPGRPGAADLQFVAFTLPPETDPERCHTIELLVALRFVSAHEADAAGASSAKWYYYPGGDPSRCTGHDAGVTDSGAALDAGRDAADTSP